MAAPSFRSDPSIPVSHPTPSPSTGRQPHLQMRARSHRLHTVPLWSGGSLPLQVDGEQPDLAASALTPALCSGRAVLLAPVAPCLSSARPTAVPPVCTQESKISRWPMGLRPSPPSALWFTSCLPSLAHSGPATSTTSHLCLFEGGTFSPPSVPPTWCLQATSSGEASLHPWSLHRACFVSPRADCHLFLLGLMNHLPLVHPFSTAPGGWGD